MTTRRKIFAFATLAILTAILYSNSLKNGFFLDDYSQLIENPRLKHSGRLFSSALNDTNPFAKEIKHFRPVSLVYRTLLYRLFKENSFYYHLSNTILFFIACYLFFILFYLLTRDFRVALLSALLFCSHPTNTTPVNFITASEVLLYGIFCILTMICFLRDLENKRQNNFFTLSLLFYCLAILTQEIAALCMGLIFLVGWLWQGQDLRAVLKACLPYLFCALLYFSLKPLLSPYSLGTFSGHIADSGIGVLMAFFSSLRLIGWYLMKLAVPSNFVFLWSLTADPSQVLLKGGGVGAVLITGLYMAFRVWRNPLRTLAMMWFLVGFLPVPVVMFTYYSAMGLIIEPHWFFFSSAGFFLLLGLVLIPSTQNRIRRITTNFIAVLLIMYWGGWTIQYNELWATGLTYGQYWLKVVPKNTYALRSIGQYYLRTGKPQLAVDYFKRVLTQGEHYSLYDDIGKAFLILERLDSASQNFFSALRLNPSDGFAANNLGVIFVKQNNFLEAQRYFKLAAQCSPRSVDPRLNLADLYIQQDRFGEAIVPLEYSLRFLKHGDAERGPSLAKLVICLHKERQYQKRDKILDLFVSENPDPSAWLRLSQLAVDLGAVDLGVFLLQATIQSFPETADAYLFYGVVLANQGHYAQAIRVWEKGFQKFPLNQQFRAFIDKAKEFESPP